METLKLPVLWRLGLEVALAYMVLAFPLEVLAPLLDLVIDGLFSFEMVVPV